MSDDNKNIDNHYAEQLFYGRRQGRPLRKGSQKAVDEILPLLQFPLESKAKDVHAFAAGVTFKGIKQDSDLPPLWVEIGFGTGEHLVELVKHYPEHRFIGCEPFINGVAHFLKGLDENLSADDYTHRVRVWDDSAEILLDDLPDASVERLYLLNPDPWPKTRHHKRRFVRPDNLDRIARVLKPGGIFITASDVAELAEWMLEKTMAHPAFTWTAKCKDDWHKRPEDWMITTRYAAKGEQAGRNEIYLRFIKE